MGAVPRQVDRKVATVPWDEAVAVAGSREALVRGRHYKTWKGWEAKQEVPAYAVFPFLLARYRGVRPKEPPERLAAALRLAARLYAQTGGHGSEWAALLTVMGRLIGPTRGSGAATLPGERSGAQEG